MNDDQRRRAVQLARARDNAATAKTGLRLAIRHLEAAQKAARRDGLLDQGATTSRLIRDTTDLLRTWPSPRRERAAS